MSSITQPTYLEDIKTMTLDYLGEVDQDYHKIIESAIVLVINELLFKYPNTYKPEDYELFTAEKVAYSLNNVPEKRSTIIVATESMLLTLENS